MKNGNRMKAKKWVGFTVMAAALLFVLLRKVVCDDQSWDFNTKAGKSYPLKPAVEAGFTPIFKGKDLTG
jgi:hypothetical protein